MDEDLISKKEVLNRTGISYGQLYRWKRKGLIPEAWFIRRSTVTGQETFFPKDKILARIAKIQALKEERSLDELVAILAPEASPEALRWDDPWTLPPIGEEGRGLLWKEGGYTFAELVALAAGAQALRASVGLGEARLLVDLLREEEGILQNPIGVTAAVVEKGVEREGFAVRLASALLGREPLKLDRQSRIKYRADLEKIVEQVKLALGEVK